MQEVIEYVSNVGFPIVISVYLLVRVEGKLTMLTQSISDLSQSISVFQESLRKG